MACPIDVEAYPDEVDANPIAVEAVPEAVEPFPIAEALVPEGLVEVVATCAFIMNEIVNAKSVIIFFILN